MNFLELENAHKSYSIKWNTELFNEYKESECWNFVDLNQESVEKAILGFLNKWGICRIPNDNKIELFQALVNLKENIQYFKGKKLWENFDFKDKKQKALIKKIFSDLEKIPKISSVAISKMMHMFNPDFFIMWDNAIQARYGFYGNVKGYTYFLQRIKKKIVENNLIEDYNNSKLKDEITLLKLIDEYNMENRKK